MGRGVRRRWTVETAKIDKKTEQKIAKPRRAEALPKEGIAKVNSAYYAGQT